MMTADSKIKIITKAQWGLNMLLLPIGFSILKQSYIIRKLGGFFTQLRFFSKWTHYKYEKNVTFDRSCITAIILFYIYRGKNKSHLNN